jgi:putative ABC transport system permease protein
MPKPPASARPSAQPSVAAAAPATGRSTAAGDAAGCAQLPAYAFTAASGHIGWTLLAGRLLTGPGEVVVGTRAASTLGVGVGDTIELAPSAGGQPLRLTVVGVGLGPAISGERLGANLLLDPATLAASERTAPLHEAFVQVAAGVPVSRVAAELGQRYEVVVRQPPDEVANLGAIGRLPELLQVVLGLLAAGALAQAVISGWRRRSDEVAVLRVLGATPPRLAAFATMLVGVPVGLGVGRLCWWGIADAVGVGTDVAFPTDLLLGLPLVAVGLAVVVALGPAASRRWLLPSPRDRAD